MKQIPNFFTLLNLFCGCMAIVYALQPDAAMNEAQTELFMNTRFMLAPLWLFAAALIDFLDGFIARLMKATSALGGQLDSLSDVVSFGVAPSIFLYKLLQFAWLKETGAIDLSTVYLFPAFLLALASAWRLAVFNLDQSQTYFFRGVPTPITGLVVASLPLIVWFDELQLTDWVLNRWVLYGFTLLLSGMMVSSVPMMSLKIKEKRLAAYQPQLILAIASVILILFFKWASIPLIYVLYLVLSLTFRKQLIKHL